MEPETPPPGNAEPISEAEALRRLRQSEDQSLQYYGAWWLGRMRSRHPDTVPLLCSALRQRQPRQAGSGVEHNAVARNAARWLKVHVLAALWCSFALRAPVFALGAARRAP